jgi:hypothetical protein
MGKKREGIPHLNQSWNESRGRIGRLLPQLTRHARASPQQRRQRQQLRSCRLTAGGGRARGRRPPPCSRRWWDCCCPGRKCRCASFRNRPDSSGRRLDINNRVNYELNYMLDVYYFKEHVQLCIIFLISIFVMVVFPNGQCS